MQPFLRTLSASLTSDSDSRAPSVSPATTVVQGHAESEVAYLPGCTAATPSPLTPSKRGRQIFTNAMMKAYVAMRGPDSAKDAGSWHLDPLFKWIKVQDKSVDFAGQFRDGEAECGEKAISCILESSDESHASDTHLAGGSGGTTSHASRRKHWVENTPIQLAQDRYRQISPETNTTFELSRPHGVKHIVPPPDHDLELHRLSASLIGFDFVGEKDIDDEEQGQPSGRVSPCTFLAWTEGCRKWTDQDQDRYLIEHVELGGRLSPSRIRHQATSRSAEYYAVRAPGADYDHAIAQFDVVTGEQLSPFYQVPSHPSVLLSPRSQVRGHYVAQREEGTGAYWDRDTRGQVHRSQMSQHDMSSPCSERTTIRRSCSAAGRYEVFDRATIHANGHRPQQAQADLYREGSTYNARHAVCRGQTQIPQAVAPNQQDRSSLNHEGDMADLIAQQWTRIAILRREEDALDAAYIAQHEREAQLDHELTDLRDWVDELMTLRHRQGASADEQSHREVQEQQDTSAMLFPAGGDEHHPQQQQQHPLFRHARDAAALLNSMAARVEAKKRDTSDLFLALELMERETDVLRQRVALERSRCGHDGDAHLEHQNSIDRVGSDSISNQRTRQGVVTDKTDAPTFSHGSSDVRGGVADNVEHCWDADLSFEVF